jgi:hypothetical protein
VWLEGSAFAIYFAFQCQQQVRGQFNSTRGLSIVGCDELGDVIENLLNKEIQNQTSFVVKTTFIARSVVDVAKLLFLYLYIYNKSERKWPMGNHFHTCFQIKINNVNQNATCRDCSNSRLGASSGETRHYRVHMKNTESPPDTEW